MSLTWDDIEKIGQEMQEQKDQWQKELFSCFKKADFDRGDKILIGQLVAENFKIPEWAKDRIAALMDWLGIYYEENIYYAGNHCPAQVLRNCVHPDLGQQIFQAA